MALDTTANLLQRFASHTLQVKLAAPVALPPLLAAKGAARGGRLEFGFEQFDDVADVLAGVRAAGRCLIDMALGKPDMEQVFVGIMNQN